MTCKHCIKKTHVFFVLDTSGSMESRRDDAIGAFNAQVDKLVSEQDNLGDTDITLVLFGLSNGPSVQAIQRSVPVGSVAKLSRATYIPQGSTPMRDAIGLATSIGEQIDCKGEQEGFLVITITDGQENSSKEWSPTALAAKIGQLKATGRWTFQVLGTNIDFDSVKDLGYERSEFASYNNLQRSGGLLTDSLTRYAASRGAGAASTRGLSVPDSQ